MKIITKRLKAVSNETYGKNTSLNFELVPEQATSVSGHYFKIGISDISLGIEKCLITIHGTMNSYFPKGWSEWQPTIKNRNGEIEILQILREENSVTFEFEVKNECLDYSIESYVNFDDVQVLSQLENFKAISTSSTVLNDQQFSFAFGKNPRRLIVSRQHPGEAVASMFMEGVLTFLQQHGPPNTDFIIVPAMALRDISNGEYRTNAGFDLNRSWEKDLDEILHVRNIIYSYGVTEVLDVHGDETSKIAYTRTDGVPTLLMPDNIRKLASTSRIRKFLSRFRNKIKTASKGCSLRDYCKANKISCTLLELPMSKDNSFQLGFEFAKANLMQK